MKKFTSIILSFLLIASAAMAQVDYTPTNIESSNKKSNPYRKLQTIALASELSAENADNSISLTAAQQEMWYVDMTENVTMQAKAGETVTASITYSGSWLNAYVYIDYDADGFTAGVNATTHAPLNDLVTYSFYSGNDNDDTKGWNSEGTEFTLKVRNTAVMPSFTAPATPGTYRVRFKADWNSLDPNGDANSANKDFIENCGAIVDVTLEVIDDEITGGEESKYPFTLTTDIKNPVLYRIESGRNAGSFFTNDNNQVGLFYEKPNYNATQFWYFVEEQEGLVKIVSYSDGRVISVPNTNDAVGSAVLQGENGSNEYYLWSVESSNGSYCFRTSNGATYLSHNGNWSGGPYMGLYNSKTDAGTLVKFIKAPTYTKNIDAGKHATLYLDYPVAIPSGVKAYIINYVTTKAEWVEIADVIPAKTGVILQAEEEGTYKFPYTTQTTTTNVSGNLLKGTLEDKDIYGRTNHSFYRLGNGAEGVGMYIEHKDSYFFTNKANEAYLDYGYEAGTTAADFYAFGTNAETGIENIRNEQTEGDGICYDLQGRKVLHPAKGIYIINGKTVYIK